MPARFEIYQDVNGLHYFLTERTHVDGVWLCFILETSRLCYRANWNLQAMTKVGHATME